MSAIVETSVPAAEPVDLATAKRFLRLPSSAQPDDDDITNIFIPGARYYVERITGLTLANREFTQYEDGFPSLLGLGGDPFSLALLFGYGPMGSYAFGHHHRNHKRLLRGPVTGIDHITYIGTDGSPHVLQPGTDFTVDFASIPGRIAPLPGARWPMGMRGLNNLAIFYSAGYQPLGTDPQEVDLAVPSPPNQLATLNFNVAIPQHLMAAILQIVVHWYQNRDLIITAAGAGGVHVPIPHQFDAIVNLERVWDFSHSEI